jgi:hypothetical protein
MFFVVFVFLFRMKSTTGATSGAGTAYPSGAPKFTPSFSAVHVTPSLVLCVCFVVVVCPFSLGHCIACPCVFLMASYIDAFLFENKKCRHYFRS